ncbi:MAG TPA: hypothetical protein VMH35_04845 [Streptosporangiaceae bacterium]|nr:hypothetical protein [Streptosporangiaceae bacterium]
MFSWLRSRVSRRWRGQRPARIQPDPFFTDPSAVEDDYGRMKPETAGRW